MKLNFIDHIVILVKDVKETERFYSKFLGKPIQVDNEQVAYKVGETKIFFGLPYESWEKHDKDRGGLNHLAFGVGTIEELKAFEKLLRNSEIRNSGIQIDKYGKKEFVWFDDPDGIRLEIYHRPVEQ